MRPETLLKTDKATVSVEALKDGKIRVNTGAWEDARVLLTDQVLEVRWRDGQVHLLRRSRIHEAEDAPKLAGPDDPYGESVTT